MIEFMMLAWDSCAFYAFRIITALNAQFPVR